MKIVYSLLLIVACIISLTIMQMNGIKGTLFLVIVASIFFTIIKYVRSDKNMNKIVEILEKREKKVIRTGSPWDWVEGYPESQWELLCRLENGHYFEDENEIKFITTNGEEIGLPKSFLTDKSRNKAIYGAPGTIKICKHLIGNDIFELTDRVGHYIRLKVEPMFEDIQDMESNEPDFKYIRLNGQQAALLYIALSENLFKRPIKGQMYYEIALPDYYTEIYIMYFKIDYYHILKESIFEAYYKGKFAKSNSEYEWNELKRVIDNAEFSQKENIENLKLYSIYSE